MLTVKLLTTAGRACFALPVPFSKLSEVCYLLDYLQEVFSPDEEGAQMLLSFPDMRSVAETLVSMVPLVGGGRLLIEDLSTEDLAGFLLGNKEGSLSKLLNDDITRFKPPLSGNVATRLRAPMINADAATLANLIDLDGTIAGAMALMDRYSSGMLTAILRERKNKINPEEAQREIATKALDDWLQDNGGLNNLLMKKGKGNGN